MRQPLPLPAVLLLLWGAGCVDYEVAIQKNFDTFTQGGPEGKADILWVIDNSASMSEEHGLLASQFSTFSDELKFTALDFRIGVTTTDAWSTSPGLVGPWLTPDTPDIADAFAQQATLGTSGSRDEHPLESAVLAADPEVGGDFVRDGARLTIQIVTDEDDHAEDDVSTYLSRLDSLKGSASYQISAIAGNEPDGCHSSQADAEVATRILEAVRATDGFFDSICSTDFRPILNTLALTAASMSDTFPLSGLPAPASIEVLVDEVAIWNRPQDGWRYDVGANAIVFEGLAVPRVGQVIVVRYNELLAATDTAETAVP